MSDSYDASMDKLGTQKNKMLVMLGVILIAFVLYFLLVKPVLANMLASL